MTFHVREIMNFKGVKLKVIFLIHFVMISWSTLGQWSHNSLLVHNLVLLSCLLLSIISPDSEELVGLTIIVNTVSVILDIVILCVYYPSMAETRVEEFSAVIAVFHMILRPASLHQLYKEWLGRGGLVTLHTLQQERPGETEVQGGSVRCGSLLQHVPGAEYSLQLSQGGSQDLLQEIDTLYGEK